MTEEPTFDDRIAQRYGQMSPAEQRVARFFQEHRAEVLIASAAALAAKAATSDATVVRAVKALGFSGLDDLRRSLADELRSSLSPAERLTRTLGEVGDSLSAAFELTLDIHLQSLEGLRRSITPELFEKAVDAIVAAQRVVVFGLGPSAAIANYLVTQLTRFGLDATSLTNTGLLFADDLQRLREGDLVIMLAYGRIYAELAALLDDIDRRRLRSLLVTDTLAATLRPRVDLVLSVARGHADMLSMHTATLGFIEALLVGVAAKRPDETLASLRALNETREKLAGQPMNLRVCK
ncbi:MAG: MurR/RpiR family transcriptional regulator [Alphaproteobacteria bacterium]|nr:MurR/RpiR family transcriptional regulator [Alphaproteobacteria bacterium]